MKNKRKNNNQNNNDNEFESWRLICIHSCSHARGCSCFNSFYIVLNVFGSLKVLVSKVYSALNMTFLMPNMTFLMSSMTFLMRTMTFLMSTMTFLMFKGGLEVLIMTFLMPIYHAEKLNMTFLMQPMTNFKTVIYNNGAATYENF